MGFDIILKSILAEGLVGRPNFARASYAKICVHFLINGALSLCVTETHILYTW